MHVYSCTVCICMCACIWLCVCLHMNMHVKATGHLLRSFLRNYPLCFCDRDFGFLSLRPGAHQLGQASLPANSSILNHLYFPNPGTLARTIIPVVICRFWDLNAGLQVVQLVLC